MGEIDYTIKEGIFVTVVFKDGRRCTTTAKLINGY